MGQLPAQGRLHFLISLRSFFLQVPVKYLFPPGPAFQLTVCATCLPASSTPPMLAHFLPSDVWSRKCRQETSKAVLRSKEWPDIVSQSRRRKTDLVLNWYKGWCPLQRHCRILFNTFQFDSFSTFQFYLFRSARTSWITFVVRPWARKIWISCIAL